MVRFELDGMRNKSRAELTAQLEELKAELKKLREARSLRGAKVADGDPDKLSEMEFLEVSRKQKAALREEYRNRELPVLRLTPEKTRAAPPHHHQELFFVPVSEDGEGKEA